MDLGFNDIFEVAKAAELVTDYTKLVDELEEQKCTTFLLPNYTAMMELRTALGPKTGNKEFWE